MKVKMYGSGIFSPIGSGGSGDQIQPRSPFPNLWAGQVGTDLYDNYAWRTDGDWIYGSYARDDFCGDEGCCCAGCRCGLNVIQNSNGNDGFEINLNNNQQKRVLAQVGTDLPSGVKINYIRIHVYVSFSGSVRGPFGGPAFTIKPYYQVVTAVGGGTNTWPTENPGGTHFNSHSRSAQWSAKWTTSPLTGLPFDKYALINTAWGIISEYGSAGNGIYIKVAEMGVEVGYDDSPYIVTTGPAIPSNSAAILKGSVDPKGDGPALATWFFQYGLNPFVSNSTTETPAPANYLYNVQTNLLGLTPETTYYYRLVARDSAGNLQFGATRSFATVSMCSTRPLLVL